MFPENKILPSMKNLFALAFLFISTVVPAQFDFETPEVENDNDAEIIEITEVEASAIKWVTNLKKAQEIAKKENKNILLYFTGSDWCAPCIALKTDFFESEKFAPKANQFIMVMIDYPRRIDIISPEQKAYNKQIVEKYNKDKSFPKILILDQNLREKDKLSGYSSFNTYKDTSHHFALVDKYLK